MYKLLLTLILTSAVASTYAQKADTTNPKITISMPVQDWNKFYNAWNTLWSFCFPNSQPRDDLQVGAVRLIQEAQPTLARMTGQFQSEVKKIQEANKPKADTTHK
jgi:hypothetical protein